MHPPNGIFGRGFRVEWDFLFLERQEFTARPQNYGISPLWSMWDRPGGHDAAITSIPHVRQCLYTLRSAIGVR